VLDGGLKYLPFKGKLIEGYEEYRNNSYYKPHQILYKMTLGGIDMMAFI
jgi:hypothetical protein